MATFSPEVRVPPPPLFLPQAFQLLGDRKRASATGSPFFGYLFMGFPFKIHVFFVFFITLSRFGAKFAASEVVGARNQVSAPVSPVEGRDRWIDREGTREQGFTCSVVNGRQALKVTGCVYYWSVSRLMGSREERAETKAQRYGSERKPRAISSVILALLVPTALRTTFVLVLVYSTATIFRSVIKKIWICLALWKWNCWNKTNS